MVKSKNSRKNPMVTTTYKGGAERNIEEAERNIEEAERNIEGGGT